jgi:plasmid stability protein
MTILAMFWDRRRNRRPFGCAQQAKFQQYDIMISYLAERAFVAQFVVRNLADSVKSRLQRRARRNGRSMEEEVRDILRTAVNEDDIAATGLGTEISALFAKVGLDSDLPELRGHTIRPVSFEE